MGCICKICYEYDRLFATHVITCSKFGKISCQFKKNAGQDKKGAQDCCTMHWMTEWLGQTFTF